MSIEAVEYSTANAVPAGGSQVEYEEVTMKGWMQRIRGAIGTGLSWAIGWVPVGALVGTLAGVLMGGVSLTGIALNYAIMFGVLGLVGGGIFAGVLRVTEGRRRFDELSLPRFGFWGAVGGLALGGLAVAAGLLGPGLSFVDAIIVGTSTLLGASSAVGTLTLARKADDGELLEAGDRVSKVGLSSDERRNLLGGAS